MNEQDRRRKRPKVVLTIAPATLDYIDAQVVRDPQFYTSRGVVVDAMRDALVALESGQAGLR